MNQIAPLPSFEFSLTVLNGPDKGTVYRLMAPTISIGRGKENDVTINGDPKVSRQHARISITPTGIVVSNLSDGNPLAVDGEPCQSKTLEDNAEIVLGKTKLRFNMNARLPVETPEVPTKVDLAPAPPIQAASQELTQVSTEPTSIGTKPPRKRTRKKNNSLFNLLLGAALFVLFLVLLDDGSQEKQEEIELRTQQQIDADIKAQEDLAKAIKERREKSGRADQRFKEAQTFYVKGLRDYKQGQFGRAYDAFNACLGLFKDHIQCQRYVKLAGKKRSELIQYHMGLGRKYMEQNQWRACEASFRNVMIMISNSGDQKYKEARLNRNNCLRMLKDRF